MAVVGLVSAVRPMAFAVQVLSTAAHRQVAAEPTAVQQDNAVRNMASS